MLSLANRVIALLAVTTVIALLAGKELGLATLVVGLLLLVPSARRLRKLILEPSSPSVLEPIKAVATLGPASALVSTVLSTADSLHAINDVAEGCAVPPGALQLRPLTPTCVHLTVAPGTAAPWETFAKLVSLRAEVREAASVSRGPDNAPIEAVIFVRGEAHRHLRGADTLQKLQQHFETTERFG